MKQTLPFLIALVCWGAAQSAPVGLWFDQANRAYGQGQFDSAALYYERIIESGMDNAAVLYNYGNALYRLNKIGPARLAYEKANRLNPNDPDITTNIRFIQSNIVDRVPEPERGFLDTVLWKLHVLISLKTQLWIALILWSVIACCIAVSFFASRNLRLWLIYLSVLFGLLFAALGSSIGIKIYESEKISYAIVVVPSTDAKNEPDGATVLFTAHEGTKFRIRKTVDDWSLVSLPNGVSGWVERKTLGTI